MFLLGVGSHLVISSRVGRKWVVLLGVGGHLVISSRVGGKSGVFTWSGWPLGHFK